VLGTDVVVPAAALDDKKLVAPPVVLEAKEVQLAVVWVATEAAEIANRRRRRRRCPIPL
jgi:hypothetical protein